MNRQAVLIFTFLLYLLGGWGCNRQKSTEAVDQDYLESRQYADFKSSFKQEARRQRNETKSFTNYLQQFSNCEPTVELSPPFQIDDSLLTQLTRQVASSCLIESYQKPSYSLSLVAKTPGPPSRGYDLYWILLDRPTVYTNQGLFVATFNQDSLLSYTSVGSYEKDLGKSVSSTIDIIQKETDLVIRSRTKRHLIYPFKQENTIQETFIVTPKGKIQIQ